MNTLTRHTILIKAAALGETVQAWTYFIWSIFNARIKCHQWIVPKRSTARLKSLLFKVPSSDFTLVIFEQRISLEEGVDLRNLDIHGTAFPRLGGVHPLDWRHPRKILEEGRQRLNFLVNLFSVLTTLHLLPNGRFRYNLDYARTADLQLKMGVV